MPHQPENNNKKEGKKETGRGERGVPEDEEEEEYCVHCTVQQVGRKEGGRRAIWCGWLWNAPQKVLGRRRLKKRGANQQVVTGSNISQTKEERGNQAKPNQKKNFEDEREEEGGNIYR